MPLQPPNLDDRDFEQLLAEARQRLKERCPEWSDATPGDPGMVLLELFAYLTETMIYRLNRLPAKAYVEFLRLIGVRLRPPAAASVTLRFSLGRPAERPVEIPRGTRATVGRPAGGAEPPVFVVASSATIPPGASEVEALAIHCEQVEAELVGAGTGQPGLSVTARRPPIIAPAGDGLDLVVGVQAGSGELVERTAARQHDGKTFRVWREVENFSDVEEGDLVYMADRIAGTITFAPAVSAPSGRLPTGPLASPSASSSTSPADPLVAGTAGGQPGAVAAEVVAALAAVPARGREIRLWYRRGGGPDGNVAAGTITTLKDAITGVQVINPSAATGGRAAESLENALVRGPQEIHSLQRAVTARDFRLLAERSSGAVARARAFTGAALWSFAAPGTVEVVLVPEVPEAERSAGPLTAPALRGYQTEAARQQVQQALDERRPLGTLCRAGWAGYKPVRVGARIVVRREEDPQAVRQRVYRRLHQTITPLPSEFTATGWGFGQALHASDVFDIALKEPGVRWIDQVRLLVDEVPDAAVETIAADAFQARTWYAGSGGRLFRSLNAGDGWEPVWHADGERVDLVKQHPGVAGHLAMVTRLPDGSGAQLYVSHDCGETWTPHVRFSFQVEDAAWLSRERVNVLLLATAEGLYEVADQPDSSPVQVLVDPANAGRAFYAVAATSRGAGPARVAVAAQRNGGVFLSTEAGRPGSFRPIGLIGEDIRVLAVQHVNVLSFLWAGAATPGEVDPGKGCFSWELTGPDDPPDGWWGHSTGWRGGSCHAVAFQGDAVYGATQRAGVQRLPGRRRDAQWTAAEVGRGLPAIADPTPARPGPFEPVRAVAVDPAGRLVMAGGARGVFRSGDDAQNFVPASQREFRDAVTLPETWLFCSGEHDVTVVSEDETD